MAHIKRVFDILTHNVENLQNPEMVSGKISGAWQKYSTASFAEQTNKLSRGLAFLGVKKGDSVAVMSANRPEWNICDFAIMQLGAYQVPLYPTLATQDIKFILQDAGVKIVFVADDLLYKKVKEVADSLDTPIEIYTFNIVVSANSWEDVIRLGENHSEIDLESYRSQITEDDILTLIYTSGTTGTPKGVMLTHKNLVQNFKNSAVILPHGISKALSFLPLSHIFERMVIYLYFYKNISVYYAESMETIVADIQEVKPQVFSTVPRLLEKIYEKIMAKGKELTGIKKALFFWAMALAEKFDFDNGFFYNLRLKIARKLIFTKWQAALGNEVIAVISGGAALNPRLARIFWAANIPVFEGYGLTETSPVITVNNPGNTMFGTVGPVIEGVEIKIGEDGEILCRGHNVMKGYYKRDDQTAENIDANGWFHTGDIGEIIDGKFLKITDRKKEMFKTAGGKYVAPQLVENKFKESPFIEQIMVLGENKKFPSALIVPNFENLKNWCMKKGIGYKSNAEIIENEQVLAKFNKEVAEANKNFGHWEQVKVFKLLPKEWSIDGGELTPKLSLKRKIIAEKNSSVIEKIYLDAESFKA
ncbi:MAG: long-chain fatty acid--CoA ligase [Sphingobacteriaceae bacterium]|nr:long-chain fatty acid--CoA ligase [Sphingobacteriaceae bacterium]